MFDVLSVRKTSRIVGRSRDLERRGFTRESLRQLSRAAVLERAARGVYLDRHAARSKHRDLLIVALRAPDGVFCLLTALAFHGLTTEMPHEVWLAIGLKSRKPALDSPPIRVVRQSAEPLNAGVETVVDHGIELRVFSAAKTVADCFKFRSRVGTEVAVAALREGWTKRRFTIDELWRYARICRVTAVMRPYLEALVG